MALDNDIHKKVLFVFVISNGLKWLFIAILINASFSPRASATAPVQGQRRRDMGCSVYLRSAFLSHRRGSLAPSDVVRK